MIYPAMIKNLPLSGQEAGALDTYEHLRVAKGHTHALLVTLRQPKDQPTHEGWFAFETAKVNRNGKFSAFNSVEVLEGRMVVTTVTNEGVAVVEFPLDEDGNLL